MQKILLVEDEADILSNIMYILEANGYQVVTAVNGKEGFEKAKKEMPALIISDILMPEWDGYEFKRRLDGDKRTKAIPFIFLTAKIDMQDLRLGMNLGADDYIIKPFKSSDLLAAVAARIKRFAQLEKGEKKKAKGKAPQLSRVLVSDKKEQIIVKVEDIKYIAAEGLYTRIHTKENKKFLMRKLLKEWEDALPMENFFRIHRSMIINLECVEKVEKWFSRTYKVYLKGVEKPFDISQRFSVKLKDRLTF